MAEPGKTHHSDHHPGACAGGGSWGYLTGIQERLIKAEGREQTLRADYEDKAAQAANLDAYLRQKEEMESTFGALLKQLPSDTEGTGLVEDITRTAIDNELTIESIDLLSEIRTEFYVELPMQVVVEGSFHKIGSFVSGVAALPRIVTLHDFEMKPESSDQHLRMSITAKTYRYLGEDE